MFYFMVDALGAFFGLFSGYVLAVLAIAVICWAFIVWVPTVIFWKELVNKNGCRKATRTRRFVERMVLLFGVVYFLFAFGALAFSFTGMSYFLMHLTLPLVTLLILYIINLVFVLFCKCECLCKCDKSCIDCTIETKKERYVEPELVQSVQRVKKEKVVQPKPVPVLVPVQSDTIPERIIEKDMVTERKSAKTVEMEPVKKSVQKKSVSKTQKPAVKKMSTPRVKPVKKESPKIAVTAIVPTFTEIEPGHNVQTTTKTTVQKSSNVQSTVSAKYSEKKVHSDGSVSGFEKSGTVNYSQKNDEDPIVMITGDLNPKPVQIETTGRRVDKLPQSKPVSERKPFQPGENYVPPQKYDEDEVSKALAGLHAAMELNKPAE